MGYMELAISTDFVKDSGSPEPYLKKISSAGFSYIHWCHEWCSDYLYSPSEMEEIGSWLKKYNLKLNDVHASQGQKSNYLSFNEDERVAGVKLIKNRIDLASKFDAGVIVLHMGIPNQYINSPDIEKFYEQGFKSLDELKPYCKSKSVKIAIENMLGTPYNVQVEQFKRLFERYDSDFLGLCYDSGHANCTFDNKEESLKFLDIFKERLISVHLADNDCSGDLHMLPLTGTIDWEKLAKIIAKSSYKKCFTMEVLISTSGIADEDAFLKEAYKRGKAASQMVIESSH